MKEIDGKKYISQDELEEAIKSEIEFLTDKVSTYSKDSLMDGMLISMLVMSEFFILRNKLFKGDIDENKQTD